MYLNTIERSLEAPDYPYAVNNVRLVCRDVLQNEELTKEHRIRIKEFKEMFEKADYMNPWTYSKDFQKLEEFRNLCKKLWQFIYYELGLK